MCGKKCRTIGNTTIKHITNFSYLIYLFAVSWKIEVTQDPIKNWNSLLKKSVRYRNSV